MSYLITGTVQADVQPGRPKSDRLLVSAAGARQFAQAIKQFLRL
jgi:hypothetical protein